MAARSSAQGNSRDWAQFDADWGTTGGERRQAILSLAGIPSIKDRGIDGAWTEPARRGTVAAGGKTDASQMTDTPIRTTGLYETTRANKDLWDLIR